MNGSHFRTFVWLRWRLLRNQWGRGGTLNAVLMSIATAGLLASAVPLFFACLVLGTYAIPRASPAQLMYAWDALIVGFLFFWSIGLLTELQRTETLSLSKFLHLPVSVGGAFAINYLSSLARLSLVLFVPAMLGFAAALVYVRGIEQIAVFPLLGAFLLMVTALTYQLQGWMAALMSNPRRRRTVVVAMTGVFVLIAQLPNLVNLYAPWGPHRQAARSSALVEELKGLDRSFRAGEFDAIEHVRRQNALLERHKLEDQRASREDRARWERGARVANLALPIGWLPFGVMAAAEGRPLPAFLGMLGMTLIGSASLWWAYRATIAEYRGQSSGRKSRRSQAVASSDAPRPRRDLLVEARLPGLSEPVSAIALGGLRSLLRAPEAKMMLLTPLIMVPVFGSMIVGRRQEIPEPYRPLIAIAAMALVLFGVLQLMGNQFGFDRDGFRVLVLSSARRRDILLGKNLAFAPLVLAMASLLLAIAQFVYPMRVDHLLAMAPQYVSMFLLFCVLANALSIVAPVRIAAGAMKASNPTLRTVLIQMVMFMVLFPAIQGVTLLPLGVEALSTSLGWAGGRAPIYLVLALAECGAVVVLYLLSLGWLGGLLQSREKAILDIVTNRAI